MTRARKRTTQRHRPPNPDDGSGGLSVSGRCFGALSPGAVPARCSGRALPAALFRPRSQAVVHSSPDRFLSTITVVGGLYEDASSHEGARTARRPPASPTIVYTAGTPTAAARSPAHHRYTSGPQMGGNMRTYLRAPFPPRGRVLGRAEVHARPLGDRPAPTRRYASGCARNHSMVRARPSSSATRGAQPHSSSARAGSTATRATSPGRCSARTGSRS